MTSPPSSTLSPATTVLTGREAGSAPRFDDEAPWIGWIRPARAASLDPASPPVVPATEFFWESPEGEALYASGEAARLECDGFGRFAEARTWLQSLRASARFEGGAGDDALIAFARFAFEDEGSSGDAGAASLFVPSRLLVRRPGERDRIYEWSPAHAESCPSGVGKVRTGPFLSEEPSKADWSRVGWDRAVEHALARIGAGDLEKVVLARTRLLRANRAWDPDTFFLRLRREYPSCYRFLYRDPGGAALVGASPERLASLRGGLVRADAVAGTSRVDGGAGQLAETALLADHKEIREHAVVAREIAAALREVSGAKVAPLPAPSVFRLQRLIHLRAQVTATVPAEVGIFDLVQRLHPTPAVAGTPRAVALETIGRMEPRRRGWYAGPIGWASATGDGDFTVGLRTALLEGERALLFAGAGIVAGSDAEREWEECESKMDVIEEALS